MALRNGGVTKDLRFATSEYAAASEVAKDLSGVDWIRSLRDPKWDRKLLSSALAVWRLPVVRLVMRPTEADSWFSENFPPAGRKIYGSRWAQSVLELVQTESEYVAGKGKQALRTNVRKARGVGVVCRGTGFNDFDLAARTVLEARRGDGIHEMRRPGPNHRVSYYVASNQQGDPLVFAGVGLFGNFGLLFVMLSNTKIPDSDVARYLLHTFMVTDLALSGFSYILAGPVLRESPGNQYFQHLLGYKARNLRFNVLRK
jgi:hypothetical protein